MTNEYGLYRDAWHPDSVPELRWTVIRLPSGTVGGGGTFLTGGPYIHANSAHITVGVVSVHVDADGFLVVTTDGASGIGTVLSAPDETLVAKGIAFGASGGGTVTRFQAAKNGVALNLSLQADWDQIASGGANLWLLYVSPGHRGTGGPTDAQLALAEIAALRAQVDALRAAARGSIARFNAANTGTVADLNTAYAGQTVADFNDANTSV